MKWFYIAVVTCVLLMAGYFVVDSDITRQKLFWFKGETKQSLSSGILNQQELMYTYQITPHTYSLSEQNRTQLFTLLETARAEFNVGLTESQQAWQLTEYALAIAPVNPAETQGADVVAIYAFPLDYAQERPDWFEEVLRDGYAFEHTVDDGGNKYFEARVNLTSGTVLSFKTHAGGLPPPPTLVLNSFKDYTFVLMPESFSLAPEQLQTAFTLLEKARAEFNENIHSGRTAWPLQDYDLAFVPSNPLTAGTDRVIVVFGIPRVKAEANPNWTSLILLRDGYALGLAVKDGGPGYFTAKINITTGTSSQFSTNGEA